MRKKETGLTLIETAVGIGLLLLIGGALVTLGLQALSAANSAKLKNQATLYAQEGLELVRRTRDTQDNFFAGFCGSYIVNLGSDCDNLGLCLKFGLEERLPSDETAGVFTRNILLDSCSNDRSEVTVTVSWQEKGQARSVVVKTILTNWQNI